MKVPEASCYPPALFSRIKVSPLKEKKKEERRSSLQTEWDSFEFTAFSKGQERKSQNKEVLYE